MTAPRTLLALLFAAVLTLAACGSDETIDAGAGPTGEGDATGETTDESLPDDTIGEAVTPDPDVPATDGFTRLVPRDDLVSLQPRIPSEVLADPADDTRLLVRYQGAAEPCSGAAVQITETDDTVAVVLQEGLEPNAAAMSCIAQVFDYEIIVQLDAPVGERMISVAD